MNIMRDACMRCVGGRYMVHLDDDIDARVCLQCGHRPDVVSEYRRAPSGRLIRIVPEPVAERVRV